MDLVVTVETQLAPGVSVPSAITAQLTLTDPDGSASNVTSYGFNSIVQGS